MSFLGLGNFGEGFVTGFADSANEALKENIKRINTRIDDIAAFKLKRAISEQDERKEEKELIEDAIKRGAAIYGEDSQEGLAFAASILKEQGSIDSYNTFMNKLQQQKDVEPNFGEVIKTWVNKPKAPNDTILTTSTIADDFLGPAKGVDTTIPKGYKMDTGLVGKLFGGADTKIQERLQTRVTSDLEARGLVKDKVTSITLPKNYFNREKYVIFNMTPEKRVEYYRNVINDASQSYNEEQKNDAGTQLAKNLKIIRDEKFESASVNDRVEMLTNESILAQIDMTNSDLSPEKQKAAKDKKNKALAQLGQYSSGKNAIAVMMGDVDAQLEDAYRVYLSTGSTPEAKETAQKNIQRLEIQKRELDSYKGTNAQRVAFKLDEAIRTKDYDMYKEAIAEAQTIDAAKADTKAIALAEISTMSRAFNNLAVSAMDLDNQYGRGTFVIDADKNVKFMGSADIKDAANKKFEDILNGVINDALSVAKTEREKQVIRETAGILKADLYSENISDATSNVIEETVPKESSVVTSVTPDTNAQMKNLGIIADSSAVTNNNNNKITAMDALKTKYLTGENNTATDDSAQEFIQMMNDSAAIKNITNMSEKENTVLRQANKISVNLKDVVQEQYNNYYKTTYPTPDDFAREVLSDTTGMSDELIFKKITDIYGGGQEIQQAALNIISGIKAKRQAEIEAKRQEDAASPNLNEAMRVQQLKNNEANIPTDMGGGA